MPRKHSAEIGVLEIAQLLGVSRQTAWVVIQSGKIKGARMIVGRWAAPRSAVLAYARRRARLQQSEYADATSGELATAGV